MPTPGKELQDFVGYAQVTGVGWSCRATTLDDLMWNIYVPESVKRCLPSQNLGATLHFSPRLYTPEYDGDTPAGSPSRMRTHPSPSMVDI